jgi:uncharacterized protein YqhQ
MKSSGIGGQAVMEGIMMRNGDKYSIAVRRADNSIDIAVEEYKGILPGNKLVRLPFIRGIFNFIDSLVIGMKTLEHSSNLIGDETEEEEPGRFEKFLIKIFGEKLEQVMTGFIMCLSILLAVGIFVLLPAWLGSLLGKVIKSRLLVNFLEGVLRILIFILYVWGISFMEEIKRTYMYHGAEHKCINCIEHGLPLTVENVAKSSKEHKRCGTSFMLIVMVISVLVFMLVNTKTVLMRFVSRILLIPVVAGISYEFLRLAGNSDHPLVNALSRPGLWLQGLTTAEPDAEMIEVGIAAVEAVFDWKAYEREQFHMEFPEEPASEDACASIDEQEATP